MIYILNETVMNGTVTMSITTSGIEAEDFESAKAWLRSLMDCRGTKYRITYSGDDRISFKIEGDFPVSGYIDNKPIKILNPSEDV